MRLIVQKVGILAFGNRSSVKKSGEIATRETRSLTHLQSLQPRLVKSPKLKVPESKIGEDFPARGENHDRDSPWLALGQVKKTFEKKIKISQLPGTQRGRRDISRGIREKFYRFS